MLSVYDWSSLSDGDSGTKVIYDLIENWNKNNGIGNNQSEATELFQEFIKKLETGVGSPLGRKLSHD